MKTIRRWKKSKFGVDKRRKHRHWQATVIYRDGEKFARVYVNKDHAERFAVRQRKSPVVKSVRISQLA